MCTPIGYLTCGQGPVTPRRADGRRYVHLVRLPVEIVVDVGEAGHL